MTSGYLLRSSKQQNCSQKVGESHCGIAVELCCGLLCCCCCVVSSRLCLFPGEVHMRVRAWLGCQAVGNGGREIIPGFQFLVHAWLHCMGPAAGVINHFQGAANRRLWFFSGLAIWSCSTAGWATATQPIGPPTHGTSARFALGWAEARCWSVWFLALF